MNKKSIIIFILGMILTASLSVYATTRYQANQIEYNDTPLDEVLDDLYTETNKDILTRLNLSSSKVSYNESYGKRIPYRSTTLNLSSGSYLIFTSYHFSGGTTGNSSVQNNSGTISLIYDNGSCNRLSGRMLDSYISPFFGTSTNIDYRSSETVSIYVCKFDYSLILEISSNQAHPESAYHESHIMAQAVKLD